MLRVQTLRLVWILCGFICMCEPVLKAGSAGVGNSRGTTSRCKDTAYNPHKATCCGREKITGGLSENMSQCCGLQAYNPLNEICCDSALYAKSSSNVKCCGNKPYDDNKQLCCGNITNKIVMTQLSTDHECCFDSQYNTKLECCCEKVTPSVQVRIDKTHCCEKNISATHSAPSTQRSNTTQEDGGGQSEEEEICTNGDRSETYFKKEGLKCCGHYYYNTTLWLCCKNRLTSLLNHRWNLIFANFDICE